MKYAQIGSISHGTMREEDLIPVFLDTLEELDPERAVGFKEVADLDIIESNEYGVCYNDEDDIGGLSSQELALHILDDLFTALDEYAPPYCYFGAHPGDGADYGFWPDIERVKEAVRDGELKSIEDPSELPEDGEHSEYDGYVHTNDHGNMTLYIKTVTYQEAWAIV